MALFSLFMMFIRTYYSPRHGRAARHGVQPPGTPGDRRLKNRKKKQTARYGCCTPIPCLQMYDECLCQSAFVKASSRRTSLAMAPPGVGVTSYGAPARLALKYGAHAYATEDTVLPAAALWA